MGPGQRLQVVVDDFDEDGLATGHADGHVIAAAGGVPGDTLEVTIDHVSPHAPRAWGRIGSVLEASPDRVAPACPNVGRCGGCMMQCTAYPRQLAWKQARLERALGPLATEILPIVPSPKVLHYRNKAKLVAAPGPLQGLILGAYAPRTHTVVDMAGCQITEEPLDPVARTLARLASEQGIVPYDERRAEGHLRYAILRANEQGHVLCVLVTAREDPALHAVARELVAACPNVVGVVENLNPARSAVLLGRTDRTLVGASELDDRVGSVRLRLSAQAFFQVNRAQAANLYEAARRHAALGREDVVVDVYSGVGGIALCLAPDVGRVIAIESNPSATHDAESSARAAQLGNIEIKTDDAARALRAITKADVVVLNPPRKGCEAEVLSAAAALSPRTISYVSCGPDSLARDLSILRGLGYAAQTVQPFDLFPHTPHIESVALLHRA